MGAKPHRDWVFLRFKVRVSPVDMLSDPGPRV